MPNLRTHIRPYRQFTFTSILPNRIQINHRELRNKGILIPITIRNRSHDRQHQPRLLRISKNGRQLRISLHVLATRRYCTRKQTIRHHKDPFRHVMSINRFNIEGEFRTRKVNNIDITRRKIRNTNNRHRIQSGAQANRVVSGIGCLFPPDDPPVVPLVYSPPKVYPDVPIESLTLINDSPSKLVLSADPNEVYSDPSLASSKLVPLSTREISVQSSPVTSTDLSTSASSLPPYPDRRLA